jgi:hypothetical protein
VEKARFALAIAKHKKPVVELKGKALNEKIAPAPRRSGQTSMR